MSLIQNLKYFFCFSMYGTRQHAGRRARALTLLNGYVEQLMSECEDGAVENLEEMQLSGGIADNELDRIAGKFTYLKPFL